MTRLLVFLAIVCSVTAGVHFYLWHRLVKAPQWPSPWMGVGTWLIVGLALSIPLGFVTSRMISRELVSPLVWTGYVWMGAMFLTLVLLLPAELLRLGAGFLGQSAVGASLLGGGSDVADPGRRMMLSRLIAGGALSGAAGLSVVGLATALRKVAVKRVDVPIARLPEALRGFKIAQLTDIHVGPTIGKAFIEQLVETTNALEPDVIAITGDLVDGSVAELGDFVRPLAGLRARHGVYFVTGNHEYYSGADEWTAFLETLGIRVLENERVTLAHEGAAIEIAGVNDWTAGQFDDPPDIAKALEGKADDAPVILLAHQPKQIEDASRLGVDLQLSGHTHGGQIFPFNYLVFLQQPYVEGLHTHGDSKLYVSPGTGYWGPPMRVGIPAEITDLRLDVA